MCSLSGIGVLMLTLCVICTPKFFIKFVYWIILFHAFLHIIHMTIYAVGMQIIVSWSFLGTSGDSGPQEGWKRHEPVVVKRGRKKSSGSAACLQQSGGRTPQGRRHEVDEDRETTPTDSESSEQGECLLKEKLYKNHYIYGMYKNKLCVSRANLYRCRILNNKLLFHMEYKCLHKKISKWFQDVVLLQAFLYSDSSILCLHIYMSLWSDAKSHIEVFLS